MPGSTSVYGFPFLEPGDPPDLPGISRAISERAEYQVAAGVPIAATAVLSSLYTLTTTVSDLPGCTVTKTTPRANSVALVTWTADCILTVAGSTSLLAVVNLMVDGVDIAYPQATWGPGNQIAQPSTRGPAGNSTTVVLPSAGSHTFKLRAAASSATGQIKLNAQHTQLSVLILP